MSEGIRGTMMIRANVEADGMVYEAGRRTVARGDIRRIPVPMQYKVFRLADGADRENWEELTVTTEHSYTDVHSYRLNTTTMGSNLISGQQSFSEFLLNLWVETEDGNEPVESKVKPVFTVYLDDMEQTTTTAITHEFKELTRGAHKAGVKATYITGETPVVTLDFNVETLGIATAESDGISLGASKDLIHYLNASDTEVTSLQVVNAAGLVVYSLENPTPGYIDPQLATGYYLVILRNGDRMVTNAKIHLNR